MALTPSAEWIDACCRKGARLRQLVVIDNGVTQWKALTGSCDQFTYPAGIGSVSPISCEINPLTCETSMSEILVDVADAWLRPILTANRLKGQSLAVSLGAAEIAENKFLVQSTGVIEDILPDGLGLMATISCLEPFTFLRNAEIVGYWVNKHPVECIYKGDGSGFFELAGLPAALIDTASFAMTHAQWSGIGQLNVDRSGWNWWQLPLFVQKPTSSFDLAKECARIVNASFVINEQGQISIARFDATKAATFNWTSKEIRRLTPQSLNATMANRVNVELVSGDDRNHYDGYEDNDTDSQTAHAFLGAGSCVVAEQFSYSFHACQPASFVFANNLEPGDTVMDIQLIHGMSGTAHLLDGGGQPAWAQLSAGQPAYFKIVQGSKVEVVKATAISVIPVEDFADYGEISGPTMTAAGGYGIIGPYPYHARFTIVRAQLGTVAQQFVSDAIGQGVRKVIDITAAVFSAQPLVKRFGNGLPLVKVETPLSEFCVQLNDMGTITDTEYLDYGKDGITSSDKWQTIRKEVDINSSPPTITWLLAWGAVNTPATSQKNPIAPVGAAPGEFVAEGGINTDVAQAYVEQGFGIGGFAGFAGTLGKGRASMAPFSSSWLADTAIAFGPSKDTYLSFDSARHSVITRRKNNGGSTPSKSPTEAWITKVVTDGAGVTGSTDLRETKAVPGDRLKTGTGPLTNLTAAGVIASATGLATGIVTAPKIADSAVSPTHTNNAQLDAGVLRNGTFTKWRTV